MSKYHELFASNGPLISTQYWYQQDKQDVDVYYQHSQKAECALVAMSSWYSGDVFEFGSHDLNTFRNILTAVHLSGMAAAYPDTHFYAFDAFGKFPEMPDTPTEWGINLKEYFKPYSDQGDQLVLHQNYINQHGLFVDKCHLVQGLFQDTCTPEFKATYGDRKIGFASIDANIAWSYKTVFEFIFDMMGESSYIYLDEGLQSPDVIAQWEQFTKALREKKNTGTIYIRNAGGFGALYRLFPITNSHPLEI